MDDCQQLDKYYHEYKERWFVEPSCKWSPQLILEDYLLEFTAEVLRGIES